MHLMPWSSRQQLYGYQRLVRTRPVFRKPVEDPRAEPSIPSVFGPGRSVFFRASLALEQSARWAFDTDICPKERVDSSRTAGTRGTLLNGITRGCKSALNPVRTLGGTKRKETFLPAQTIGMRAKCLYHLTKGAICSCPNLVLPQERASTYPFKFIMKHLRPVLHL